MKNYIGIDLGTSSVKLLLVGEDGTVKKEAHRSYPLYLSEGAKSEQDPRDWLLKTEEALEELLTGITRESVYGVAVAGQMHGLVLLDKNDEPLRRAILWNDGRSEAETRFLNEEYGLNKLVFESANMAFPGFTLPKLLWVKNNEPALFAKIKKVMLPKDYLVYMLSGVFATDASDAAGTLYFDVKNRSWSAPLCALAGISPDALPTVYESEEKVGMLKAKYNLPNAVLAAGAGDNAAAAVGVGAVHAGDANLSLGTSGTLFIAADRFPEVKNPALHTFAYAKDKWHFLGCILSAASAQKWFIKDILRDGYDKIPEETQTNVYFLPYLMGERCPHNDPHARGAFIGLTPSTTKEEMSLAVLEGVAFALRDCLELARASGVTVTRSGICGGGAKSPLWKKIVAEVLNLELHTVKTEEGPAYGAAMLSMVASGAYPTTEAAADALVETKETVTPEKDKVAYYEKKYATFKTLYTALKDVFAENY